MAMCSSTLAWTSLSKVPHPRNFPANASNAEQWAEHDAETMSDGLRNNNKYIVLEGAVQRCNIPFSSASICILSE
jgi:hypothetical protein